MAPTPARTARRSPRRRGAAPTRGRSLRRFAAIALVLSLAGTAQAVRDGGELNERTLETAGAPARIVDRTSWVTPDDDAAKRWVASRFSDGRWTALWDADTGVPQRIYGEGIAAPGSMADPAIAEKAARELLAAELGVLAPGAELDDFVLALDVVHMEGKRRTVSFAQHRDGLRVLGARVGFLFANDRIFVISSSAAPDLDVAAPRKTLTDAKARGAAEGWIEKAHGGDAIASDVGAAAILPIVGDRGALEAHVVVPVTVDLASPRGRWAVYVDAVTGAPVARRQQLQFASGTVHYNAPDRYPPGTRSDYPAAFATHTVDGDVSISTLLGSFMWSGSGTASVSPGLTGTFVSVITEVEPASTTFSLAPNATAVWNESAEEKKDAQLSAFVHTNLVKQFAKDHFDNELDWLFAVIEVSVNEDGTCNAYSTGDDIHFYPEGGGCANTARLADVVYHEFGHSLHGQSLLDGSFDSAFSEGISDVLSALITDDPAMGIGFFLTDQPLRHIDPESYEHRWPEDIDLDVHETGLVIAGAMWDLREALIAELGTSAGKTHTEDLFYEMVRRSDGIPTAYAEVLAADDDDGNLTNGTPNDCLIDHVFAAHGLTERDGASFGIVAPRVEDNRVLTLAQPVDRTGCPIAIESATVTWRLRDTPTVIGNVAFDVGSASAVAAIPPQLDGEVVQYQIHATLDDGTVWTLPRNYADDWYELYVGPVTKLYCANMDVDPELEDGWQMTGDFRWAPAEPGSSLLDPAAPLTGTALVGTRIGGRGTYREEGQSDAILPEIDVTGYTNVRLQYWRWLTVEDANRDRATILADGAPLWVNAASPTGQLDHRDIEWRFQDVDLSALAGNGKVRVTFQLVSDADRQLGGWNLDDVCIVAAGAPVCGDERVSADEQCDDGNNDDGDGCSSGCSLEGGDGEPDASGCCSTGTNPAGGLLLGLLTLGLLRRRRV